jgi:translocation and assembly module TamB
VEAVAAPTGLEGLPPVAAAALGPAPDLAAVVSVDAGVLTIESAIVTAAVGRVEADGIVHLPDRRATLRWQGTLQPELGLSAVARTPWAVPVQPVEAHGDLSVTWAGQTRLEGNIAIEEVLLPSIRMESVDTRIIFASGDGPMPLWVRAGAERIEAGRLVIERAQGWGRLGAAEQAAGIALLGRWGANFSAVVEGEVRRRGESVRVQINRFDVPHPEFPVRLPEPLVVAFDAGTTRVERVVVAAGPARLVVDGMTDGSRVRGRVTLEPMDLATLPGMEDVVGTAGATLILDGSLRLPRLAGTLSLADVGLIPDSRRPDVRLQVAGQVSYEDGMLRAEAGIDGSHGGRFDVHAQVPVLWRLAPWTLDAPAAEEAVMTADGEMNLDVLNALPVMTEQRLSGILELDLRATGHPLRPAFSGTGRVRDGRYEHFLLGTSLRHVDLSLEVDDRTLRITSLQARDQGAGSLQGHGRIQWRPGEQFPVEIACDLRDLHLIGNDLMSATAAGTLQLRRDPATGMTLDGSITLDPVDIFIPQSLPLPPARYTIVDPRRPPTPAPEAGPATRGAAINLAVRIAIPSRLFVVGRGLDSEWSGRLHLAAATTAPRITGQLQPLRGGFDFFGQPFQFRESTVRLTGEHPPRPSLDLTLERARSDLTALLKIGGTTAQPQFALESEPPMPVDELLPQLLFGRHGSEISALQALRIAQATRTLQGKQSAFDFMGNAQQALGVDQLDIEGADSEEGATRITAGKYLSDRVYLEGSNDIGSRGGQLSLEVELTPRISLTTDVREEMKQGVGIKFKRHF